MNNFIYPSMNQSLTLELANGQRIPSVNRPSKGPPMIPNILTAACMKRHISFKLQDLIPKPKGELFVWNICCTCIRPFVCVYENSSTLPVTPLPSVKPVQPFQCTEPRTQDLQTWEISIPNDHSTHSGEMFWPIHSLSPFEVRAKCFSDMLVYGLIRSSTVTAARALMLEDTVLGVM